MIVGLWLRLCLLKFGGDHHLVWGGGATKFVAFEVIVKLFDFFGCGLEITFGIVTY